jgi:hypothetical protein
MKLVTVALVVMVVVAGVLLVMAINKSEIGVNNTTLQGQNSQNMPYSQAEENTSQGAVGEVESPHVMQK